MSIYHLSISVLKVGRQLVGSLAVAAFFISKRLIIKALTHQRLHQQQFPLWEFRCSLRSQKGREVVRFSDKARKTNHITPFFYERSEQKKPKRKLLLHQATHQVLTLPKFKIFGKLSSISFFLLLGFYFLLLQGCIREEEPVAPHLAGDVVSRSIALSSDYQSQVFYNLEKDSIIGRNLKTDWDVSFDVLDTEGGKIYLNQAKYMFAWRTDKLELEQLKDTVGFFKNRRWDAANNPDTMGIGSSKGLANAFWIDRGFNEFGDPLDFIRFKIVSVTREKYVFKILRQGTTNSEQFEIQRDTNYNRVYFSFTTNRSVKVEPKKTEWDLHFTQYIHTFREPYTPYLVVGVLLNPLSTQGAVDSILPFGKIDRTMAQSFKLTSQSDVIGYGWKVFSGNVFKVKLQYNYIIQNQKNQLFKMRFVDFYDNRGTKGTPKFEFQRL